MSLALSPIYLSTIALDTTLKNKMKKWFEKNKTSFKEVTTHRSFTEYKLKTYKHFLTLYFT